MEEGTLARVIPFPTPMSGVRTCWDCVWHSDVQDDKGLISLCTLFVEEIHDEGQADDCEAYDT